MINKLALGLGLVLAGLAAWSGRGEFSQYALGIPAAVAGALSLVAAGLFARAGARKEKGFRRSFTTCGRRSTLVLGLILGPQALAFVPGYLMHRRDIIEARGFCARLILELDSVGTEGGVYPEELDSLLAGRPEELPRLLRDGDFYLSDGESYVLSFSERDSTISTVQLYSSDTGAWQRF